MKKEEFSLVLTVIIFTMLIIFTVIAIGSGLEIKEQIDVCRSLDLPYEYHFKSGAVTCNGTKIIKMGDDFILKPSFKWYLD